MNTLKNPKAFINHLQTTDDAYKILEGYSRTKKMKVLLVVDNTMGAMEANKKLNSLVTDCS